MRLCFQVFLMPNKTEDGRNKYVSVKPIVSNPICDQKCMSDLVIHDISDNTSPTVGGKKVMLFCEKVVKTDIQIRFFKENGNNFVEWEAWGKFARTNVHRQLAISFKTPPYITNDIDNPVKVFIQLVRPSDGRRSEPLEFQYVPQITNINNAIRNKKRKIDESKELHEYLQSFQEQQRQRAKMEINIHPMAGGDQVPGLSHQSNWNFPINGQLQNNPAQSYYPQEQQQQTPQRLYNNVQHFPQNSVLQHNVCYPYLQQPMSNNFSQLPLNNYAQQQENINFSQQLEGSHLQQQRSQLQNNHLQEQNHIQSLPHFQEIYSNLGNGLNIASDYNAVPQCSNVGQMHNSTPQNINQFCENNLTLINHQESNSDNNFSGNNFENIENVENMSDSFSLLLL